MQKEKEPFPEDNIPENWPSKKEEKIEEKKKEKETADNQRCLSAVLQDTTIWHDRIAPAAY